MRKDTSFSNERLTQEEFKEKYLWHGELPYQYHTATFEDGRDEREQFLFNNVRALKGMIDWHAERYHELSRSAGKDIAKLNKRINALMAANVTLFCLLASLLIGLWNKL